MPNSIHALSCGLLGKFCTVLFALAIGSPLQALLTNGDFDSGLDGWKTAGLVVANDGRSTLTEGTEAPQLYQAVSVDGYVYELRLDFFLGTLSTAEGSGTTDTAQIRLYGGTDAGALNETSAAEERILIEVSSSGVVQVAPNASAVPNAALGPGWYSAVVDFASDFPAIAVAVVVVNNNALADSAIQVGDVQMGQVDRGRLANISNRGPVGVGADIMIPGFVIAGTTDKTLLIRGVGPTLGGFGVPGTIEDPAIGLFRSGEFDPVQSSDNWEGEADLAALRAAFSAVGAFGLDEGSADAAMLVRNLRAGGYTVQVSGNNDGTGVALAEIYDLGALLDGPTEVVNISNRGFVGVDAEVQIPGFVIGGARGKKVLIRAVGPTLAGFGVGGALADPILELYLQGSEAPLATNDNWEAEANAAQIKATAGILGAFALLEGEEGKDAAMLLALEPGSYTAIAKGKDGSTGVALVEVYMVTENQRPLAINNSVYVDTAASNVLANQEILGNDIDPDADVLKVGLFSQPEIGSVALNGDGELVYTAPVGFLGEAIFSYRASDGEFESVPATIALQVTPANAVIWKGGSSGDFTDPANWVGGEVPGENDPVWIAPSEEATITVDADTTVGSVRIGGTAAPVTFRLDGRTLTAAGGLDVQPGSTLEMSGGRLVTTQPVQINGALNWSGGTMAGSGDTVIGADSIVRITGDVNLAGGHGLINNGTIEQTGLGRLRVIEGTTSTVTNASGGQWNTEMTGDRSMAYPNAGSNVLNFVNDGTITKSPVANTLRLGWINGSFNFTNNGVIDVLGGTLELNYDEPASYNGELNLAEDATVLFNAGTHEFASEGSITEVGTIEVSGGATSVTFPKAESFDKVVLSNGSINAPQGLSIKAVTQSGGQFNTGENDLVFTESFAWSGGTHRGSGDTIVGDGLTLTMTGLVSLAGGHGLINNGTIEQSGQGRVRVIENTTSTITNTSGAQWNVDIADGRSMAFPDAADNVLNFVNDGTITKSDKNTRMRLGWINGWFHFTNNGVIDVPGGTLEMDYGEDGTYNGELNLAEDATLWFTAGTHEFTSEGSITEAGTIQVSGGTTSVTFSKAESFDKVVLTNGSINAPQGLSIKAVTHSGGQFNTGENDLVFTESFAWSGGTHRGSGDTIVGNGLTLTMTGLVSLAGGHGLINHGTIEQSGQGRVRVIENTTSTITNASGAQWNVDIADGRSMAFPDAANNVLNFVNDGTITKSDKNTRMRLGWINGWFHFTNNGVIDVPGGTFEMDYGEDGTYNGELNLAEDATLWFTAGTHEFSSDGSITEAGTIQVSGGTTSVTFPKAESFDAVVLSGGSINAPQGLSIKAVTQSGGQFNTGENDLVFTESFAWSGGTHRGSGDTIVGNGLTLTLTGLVNLAGGHGLINHGTIEQSDQGQIRVIENTTSTITNATGAQWNVDIANLRRMAYPNAASNALSFVNDGTITKSESGNTLYLGWVNGTFHFTNNGTVEVLGGRLEVEGTSAVLAAGGTLRLTTNGSNRPMVRKGGLTIAGSLVVSLATGYDPANGTTIRLIDYTSKSGTFGTLTPPQGRTVTPSYAGDGLDVTFN